MRCIVMPDPNPDWFFQPRRQTAAPAEDQGTGLISPPAGRGRPDTGQPDTGQPDTGRLERTDVDQIALEHLLVGSAITGSPAFGGGGGLTANPGSGTGPTSTGSYLFSGGDTRTPVTVLLDPPERELPPGFGRRPVVAVLDTGVRAHPWLDVAPGPGGGYDIDPHHDGDGF